jgi:hypothetical protein
MVKHHKESRKEDVKDEGLNVAAIVAKSVNDALANKDNIGVERSANAPQEAHSKHAEVLIYKNCMIMNF